MSISTIIALVLYVLFSARLVSQGQGAFVLVVTLVLVIACLLKLALRRRSAEDHYPDGHF